MAITPRKAPAAPLLLGEKVVEMPVVRSVQFASLRIDEF
jgi:hypothetical protein